MANPVVKIKAVNYVRPQPYISWHSKDVEGLTRAYAPLQVQLRVENLDGLWGNDFRDIAVQWNFGDVDEDFSALAHLSSTECRIPDRNANTAIKAWAGHVYNSPGTYYPQATLTDALGNTMTLEGPEIVVASQDDYYAAFGQTICYSQDGTFTGAPAGAALITVADGNIGEIKVFDGSNKRYLFQRGQPSPYQIIPTEDTGSRIWFTGDDVNIFLGAFGTGAKPYVEGIQLRLENSNQTVVDGLRGGSDYDPSAENKWWNDLTALGEEGVEGVDWEAKDPLPSSPPSIDGRASTNNLYNNCDFIGIGEFRPGFLCTVNNTRVENFFSYGVSPTDTLPSMILGSTIAQPDGTPDRAMGTGLCSLRGDWNTTGCDSKTGVPVPNHPSRGGYRSQNLTAVMSKCYTHAGGGHSASGGFPQPSLRLSQGSGESTPQESRKIAGYISQSHIVGRVTTANRNTFYPYGFLIFDSVVFEKKYNLKMSIGFSYGNHDIDNCLFLANDPRAPVDAFPPIQPLRTIIGSLSGEGRPSEKFLAGADHSQTKCRLRNTTLAILSDHGIDPNSSVSDLSFGGLTGAPQVESSSIAFFTVNPTLTTSDIVPVSAPDTEIDTITFLPNAGTTFDTVGSGKYPPMDFDGNFRTPETAIHGFKKRTT